MKITNQEKERLREAAPELAKALKFLLFVIEKCEGYALPLQVLKAAEEAAEVLRGTGLLTPEKPEQ